MSEKDDFDTALEAIARLEGKSVSEVKAELLRSRLGVGQAPREREQPRQQAITRREMGDASGGGREARREAIQRHNEQENPGSPVVRYREDPYGETAAEAMERWLEEETELSDGVHGFGGSTAGGIFGDGPIATNVYDPLSAARADGRAAQVATTRAMGQIASVVEQLMDRLPGLAPRAALPAQPRRRLGPKR